MEKPLTAETLHAKILNTGLSPIKNKAGKQKRAIPVPLMWYTLQVLAHDGRPIPERPNIKGVSTTFLAEKLQLKRGSKSAERQANTKARYFEEKLRNHVRSYTEEKTGHTYWYLSDELRTLLSSHEEACEETCTSHEANCPISYHDEDPITSNTGFGLKSPTNYALVQALRDLETKNPGHDHSLEDIVKAAKMHTALSKEIDEYRIRQQLTKATGRVSYQGNDTWKVTPGGLKP